MKKIISIIILSSLLFISCNKDEVENKKTQVAVNNIKYNFNLPEINTDYNITKTSLDENFNNVTIDIKGDDVIINASDPKGSDNLFSTIALTYHSNFYGFTSFNVAFTYSIKDIDSESFIKIKELVKKKSTPKL